jgi:hypothetical protein
MDNFNLNNIPNTNFVFDFKTPDGYLPFGYTKHTFALNILNKLKSKHEPFTGYYPAIHTPYDYQLNRTAAFSTHIVEYTPHTKFVLTNEIRKNISKTELYVVVLEALNVNNLFEYYSNNNLKLNELFSPELLNLIKNNKNFKILFMDIREGSYSHNIDFLVKINNFLNENNIEDRNKVIVSTNNNFIDKLNQDLIFKTFKNRISLHPNNYYLLTAGRFISELRVKNNSIVENDYEFSIQQDLNFNNKEKYFLMYNRNSERIHRAYFVNELYKLNLLDKGYVSFFENPHLESFLEHTHEYHPLKLKREDLIDIKNNYKNYYPLIIDEINSEKVADFHNFLSRKDEYEKSYFTIISETNAESEYNFITEKTIKPIMNLHPFLVLGNPKTLQVLKSFGFITFDRWWDESYDTELDFKKRANLVLSIVNELCSKSKEEMNTLVSEMKNVLIHNKNLLHKLSTSKEFEKQIFKILIKNINIV